MPYTLTLSLMTDKIEWNPESLQILKNTILQLYQYILIPMSNIIFSTVEITLVKETVDVLQLYIF